MSPCRMLPSKTWVGPVTTWYPSSVSTPAAKEGTKEDAELRDSRAVAEAVKVVWARFAPVGEWERPGRG